MSSHYHIDAQKFSLDKFRQSLQSRKLIPSRVTLKEDIENKFTFLKKAGLKNLNDLLDALKNKKKLETFSGHTGLSIEYLTLLNREANSYFPNPVSLSKYSGISNDIIKNLGNIGIKNSKQLFEKTRSSEERQQLSTESKLSPDALLELIQLSDLARLYGVGPVFARMIHDIGIRSVKEFISYSPEEIIEIYEKETQKKADFSPSDIEFTLEIAKDLEIEN